MDKLDKNLQGIQYMQEGKWEEAVKTFTEIIEESPEDPIGYINFGNLLAAIGDNDRAMHFFKEAIKLDENAASAYYSMGNLYYENEQFQEAKAMFEMAMVKGMDSSDNFFMLGMSLISMEQPRLALPYLQRCTELNENDSEAFFSIWTLFGQSAIH